MTRVAVVIPVHDDGEIIRDAVASVREAEPVQIAVVDDGSSDPATLAALDGLEAEGVNVIHQANSGPGAARMTGVAATTAPYVFPLDADDLLEPGALAALADRLERDPQAGFCWGDYVVFGDSDGRYRAPSTFLPWTLTWVNPYPVSSLIRRDALALAGGWPARGYEDWSLWLAFVDLGIGGVACPQVVYRRRLHGYGRRVLALRRAHRRLYGDLRRRHPVAFANRRSLARAERPSLPKRLLYPIVFGRRAVVPFKVEAWLQRTMMKRGLRLSR